MNLEPNDDPSRVPRHPVAVVVDRTGLSADLLRVWERRYRAVTPGRSAGGQRLYSDADVERLRLLGAAVAGGRRVGQLAALSTAAIARLVAEDRAAAEPSGTAVATADVDEALARVRAFDARGLDVQLRRSAALLGAPFLERVVAPLLRRLGEEWHAGRIGIAEEHLASSVIEAVVVGTMRAAALADGPVVVVATPAGARHVIAAALAGATAAAAGWGVVFLGGDLPASEIAAAARARGARAVAVSALYADDAAGFVAELRALRAGLPPEVRLLAGGAAAVAARDALRDAGVEVGESLAALREALDALR